MADQRIMELVAALNGRPQVPPRGIDALELEKRREAELVRQRQMQQQMMQAHPVQQSPQEQLPTIAQYQSQMTAQDPSIPTASPAPAQPSMWGNVPGIQSLIQALMSRQAPDPQLDKRLGGMTGNMALNNQRHRQLLDDFERERIRANMALPKVQ